MSSTTYKAIIIVVAVFIAAGILFYGNSNISRSQLFSGEKKSSTEQSNGTIVLKNQGGTMEGHTPRGFRGMGTGLFAGDNLNPNFPNGDGVQMFLSFDLREVSLKEIALATFRSSDIHIQGTPFKDLGALQVETVHYNQFSSALFNLETDGRSCTVDRISGNVFLCDVTETVQDALDDGLDYAQFRLRFEKAGDGDGSPDLVSFYKTNSNINEPGIFELEITPVQTENSTTQELHVPVVLHLIKNSGVISSTRDIENITALFKKSQEIWDQAHIVFDTTTKETELDTKSQEAIVQENFNELYEDLSLNKRALHIFFTHSLGSSNGIAVPPSLAFIADRTSVNDFRATAHEIGHLLGLSHTPLDRGRLLFQGVNGSTLIEEEVDLARERAVFFQYGT